MKSIDFLQVIIQILILFIIMGIGYFLRRKGTFSKEGIKNFSMLIFEVTMPAMILVALAKTQSASFKDIFEIGVATVISYIFLFLMAMIMPRIVKAPKGSKGLYSFMTLFGNVGYVGFPMIIAILGKEALFLAALFNIPYTLLVYTIGVYFIISSNKGTNAPSINLKQFINPGIFMTALGLLIFLIGGVEGIEASNNKVLITIVTMLLDIASVVGAITTPLAMIVVGASLYGVNLRSIYKNYRVIIFSLIRMIIFPVIIGIGLTLLGIGSGVVSVAIVLVGMPVATATVIITNKYNGNVLEASEAVFISTILILVTSPVLMFLIVMLT